MRVIFADLLQIKVWASRFWVLGPKIENGENLDNAFLSSMCVSNFIQIRPVVFEIWTFSVFEKKAAEFLFYFLNRFR